MGGLGWMQPRLDYYVVACFVNRRLADSVLGDTGCAKHVAEIAGVLQPT